MALSVRLRFRPLDGSPGGERIVTHLPVRLGRSPMNDCPLASRVVSQFHAVVDLMEGQLVVRDLNSSNGIYSVSMGATQRLPAGQPIPLASIGNTFRIADAIEVTVDRLEQQDRGPGLRVSHFSGSVLGNEAVLHVGLPPYVGGERGSAPPPPPEHVGASPTAPWAEGLPALPALSMRGPPAPPWNQPAPGPAAAAPAVPPPGSLPGLSMSLPDLPGLSGPSAGPGPSSPIAPAARSSSEGLRSLPLPAPAGASLPRAAHARAPSHAAGSADLRSTMHLNMSSETLALAGLRELAASLLPGQRLETTGDIARLLTKLHDLVEVFCRHFIALRDASIAGPPSHGLNWSPTAQRVELARDPAELAAALLDWRSRDLDPPQVVETVLGAILVQHATLVEGVMQGVEELLGDLSPEAVEREASSGGAGGLFGGHKALWRSYEERFNALASAGPRFEQVVGAEFANMYREYRGRRARSMPPPKDRK